MPKNTELEIIDLGFIREMFRKDTDDEFTMLIGTVLSEQAVLLQGRIGAANYASSSSPQKDYVKRAELCLTAAELIQRRINVILGNVIGTGMQIDVLHEGTQKKVYMAEANDLINKILTNAETDNADDFCSSAMVSDHFGAVT